jgi:hypothetical protein
MNANNTDIAHPNPVPFTAHLNHSGFETRTPTEEKSLGLDQDYIYL